MSSYIIGYDIADKRRLQRIYKRMLKHAVPIQYSIFIFNGNKHGLDKCINEILNQLHHKQDDFRVYPLVAGAKKYNLGKSVFLDGIIFSPMLSY